MPGLTTDIAGRSFQDLDLPDAEVFFYPAFFSTAEADHRFRELRESTAWRQATAKSFGRTMNLPRLTAWYGDEGTHYTYSGIANVPLP